MKEHKWLTQQTFIELKRAYASGMLYKVMAYRFGMTVSQISWYLRDQPKRQARSATAMDKLAPARINPYELKRMHQQAKKELKQEIKLAKKEQPTAPLYRPSRDKVW